MMSPTPQRIIWLYKRWQPLYDEIKGTVHPRVEFIPGIPIHLDQDTFINPSMRNLVILDDLMTSSAKDPRMNELFTEGIHHMNLSVIAYTLTRILPNEEIAIIWSYLTTL
jgi:hypothetical protein